MFADAADSGMGVSPVHSLWVGGQNLAARLRIRLRRLRLYAADESFVGLFPLAFPIDNDSLLDKHHHCCSGRA
jgi:hypothetical protein